MSDKKVRNLPRHLMSLQYLRAIAAISVVYFHASIQESSFTQNFTLPIVGSSGVDIFFVLSGFVMWVSTVEKKIKPSDFIRRRIVRIVPLYAILTIAASFTSLIMPSLVRSTKFDITHLAASLLFIPWRNPAIEYGSDVFAPVIVPGWTLNMEMMFYVIFSFCLLFPTRFRVPVLGMLITSIFVFGMIDSKAISPLSFYGNSRLFEFLYGVFIAAYLTTNLTFRPILSVLAIAIGFLTIFPMELLHIQAPKAIALGVPAFLIVVGCVNLECVSRVPRLPLLEAIGDASYAIYLTHIFVIAASRVWANFIGISFHDVSFLTFVIPAVAFSALLGIIVHRYIEKPLVNVANSFLNRERRPPNNGMLR